MIPGDFRQRRVEALRTRIDELMDSPPLVHLLDHYLDQLTEAQVQSAFTIRPLTSSAALD